MNAIGPGPVSDAVPATPESDAPSIVASLIFDAIAKQYVVTNAADFPDAVWGWQSETGAPVEGQTGSTLAQADAPVGLMVRAIPDADEASASEWCLAPLDLMLMDERFDGNETFDGYKDWLSYNVGATAPRPDDSIIVADGELIQTKANLDASSIWRSPVPLSPSGVLITMYDFWDASGQSQAQRSARELRIGQTPSNRTNFVRFYTTSFGWQLRKNAGSGETTLANVTTGVNAETNSAGFSVTPDRARTYIDRVETPASAAAGGWDVSDVTFAGDWLSFAGATISWMGEDPVRLAKRITIESILPKTFNLISVAASEPTDEEPVTIYTITGTCTDSIAEYDWAILGPDGEVRKDWVKEVAVDSEGVWTIVGLLPDSVVGTTDSQIALRVSGEEELLTIQPLGLLQAYDPIEPTTFAMNSQGSLSYGGSDTVKDRGRVGSWRYAGGSPQIVVPSSDKNDEGWPVGPIPATHEYLSVFLFEGTQPGTRFGEWNVEVNAPCTIVVGSASNATVTNITSTTAKITQLDPTSTTTVWLGFRDAEIPPEGLQVSCLLIGDTSAADDHMTPEAAAIWHKDNFGGRFGWRNMKNSGAELGGYRKPSFAGGPEYAAAVTRQTGGHVMWSVPYLYVANEIETKVRDWLEHFRDHASPAALLGVEACNEGWNLAVYPVQAGAMITGAANHGFVDGVVVPLGITVTDERYSAGYNEAGGVDSGITRRDFEPGEWFYCIASGNQRRLMKCVAASTVPSGTTVPAAGDSNFEVLSVGPFEDALRIEQAYQQARLGQIGKEILGNRCVSVLGAWINDDQAKLVGYMLSNDSYKHIDYWSPSFYAGKGSTYASLDWASKHTSDFPAFKAGFYDKIYESIDTMLNSLRTKKHGVFQKMLQAGVKLEDIPKMGWLYEGGDHNTITTVPEEERAGLLNAILECLRSDEDQDALEYELTNLSKYIGGILFFFADTGYPVYNTGTGPPQMQWFGMRQRQFDSALNNFGADERRYLAAKAVFEL